MRELEVEKISLYVGSVAVVAGLSPIMHRIKRTRGRNPIFHVLFLAVFIALLVFVPEWIQDEIFSPGGVVVLGTVIPIYESIVAVCSVGTSDDTEWLQFWVASGMFAFATEFMDDILNYLPQAGEHWYEFEFFLTAWFMLPFTDGSGLVYDFITKPYIAPVAQLVKSKTESWMGIFLLLVNTSYLWLLWLTFLSLPEEARRFLTVCLGVIYPMAASTIAITTESSTREERFWLIYWACYSILFVSMDYLENFIGNIRGFYSLCAVATLYLWLPMFRGADVIFRRVLVPLSGQHEALLMYDAYMVRLDLEKAIPESHRERVLAKAAEVFTMKKGKAE